MRKFWQFAFVFAGILAQGCVVVVADDRKAEPDLPPRIDIKLKDVRWQALPEQVESVYVDFNDRVWYSLRSPAPGADLAFLKKRVARVVHDNAPHVWGLRVVHVERSRMTWFWDAESARILGFNPTTSQWDVYRFEDGHEPRGTSRERSIQHVPLREANVFGNGASVVLHTKGKWHNVDLSSYEGFKEVTIKRLPWDNERAAVVVKGTERSHLLLLHASGEISERFKWDGHIVEVAPFRGLFFVSIGRSVPLVVADVNEARVPKNIQSIVAAIHSDDFNVRAKAKNEFQRRELLVAPYLSKLIDNAENADARHALSEMEATLRDPRRSRIVLDGVRLAPRGLPAVTPDGKQMLWSGVIEADDGSGESVLVVLKSDGKPPVIIPLSNGPQPPVVGREGLRVLALPDGSMLADVTQTFGLIRADDEGTIHFESRLDNQILAYQQSSESGPRIFVIGRNRRSISVYSPAFEENRKLVRRIGEPRPVMSPEHVVVSHDGIIWAQSPTGSLAFFDNGAWSAIKSLDLDAPLASMVASEDGCLLGVCKSGEVFVASREGVVSERSIDELLRKRPKLVAEFLRNTQGNGCAAGSNSFLAVIRDDTIVMVKKDVLTVHTGADSDSVALKDLLGRSVIEVGEFRPTHVMRRGSDSILVFGTSKQPVIEITNHEGKLSARYLGPCFAAERLSARDAFGGCYYVASIGDKAFSHGSVYVMPNGRVRSLGRVGMPVQGSGRPIIPFIDFASRNAMAVTLFKRGDVVDQVRITHPFAKRPAAIMHDDGDMSLATDFELVRLQRRNGPNGSLEVDEVAFFDPNALGFTTKRSVHALGPKGVIVQCRATSAHMLGESDKYDVHVFSP